MLEISLKISNCRSPPVSKDVARDAGPEGLPQLCSDGGHDDLAGQLCPGEHEGHAVHGGAGLQATQHGALHSTVPRF